MRELNARFYIVEKHRGFTIPDDDPVWTRFREWVEACKKRESVSRTRSEEQYYEQVSDPLSCSTDPVGRFMRDI